MGMARLQFPRLLNQYFMVSELPELLAASLLASPRACLKQTKTIFTPICFLLLRHSRQDRYLGARRSAAAASAHEGWCMISRRHGLTLPACLANARSDSASLSVAVCGTTTSACHGARKATCTARGCDCGHAGRQRIASTSICERFVYRSTLKFNLQFKSRWRCRNISLASKTRAP